MSFRFVSNIRHIKLISDGVLTQTSTRNSNVIRYTNQRHLFCADCVRNRASLLSRALLNTNIKDAASSPSQTNQLSSVALQRPGIFQKIKKMCGFYGNLRYKKPLLFRAGLRLYLCCTELIIHEELFEDLGLPDTFNSWFRITELHVWLVMCRLASEQQEGILVRNLMIKSFWKDVDRKSKQLGPELSKIRSGVRTLTEQFKGQCITYDEGLLDDDKVLAGALWRGFYDQTCEDSNQLELLVHYVRKQIRHLDEIESAVLLSSGLITFLPMRGENDDIERNKIILHQILKQI